MKILIFADIHGEFEKISKIIQKIKVQDVDLILCPGDFTDMFNTPEGFSQIDIADMILQKILSLGVPVLCVPGNHDPYDVVDLFKDYGVNLHGTIKTFNNISFLGWGGAETPFNTNFEPTEEETREVLFKLEKKLENKKFILVTHNPPKNTKLDKTISGEHVGSKTIREFIEKKQPILSISAHIHESRGEDRIGNTVLFYPGASFEGYYGIVDIDKKIHCKIKRLNIL